MLEYAKEPFTDEQSLSVLNTYVRAWFTKNFGELTPPQKYSFKLISEKKNVLITAPTGSGKTMSAFLSIVSRLFDYSLEGKLENKIYCIYVSPLRALNNDIYRNLTKPLDEIYEMIKKAKGVKIIKENIRQVTIGVRTGDTTQAERQKMLAHPPNILVTTPESLAILLNSQKFVEHMLSTEFFIIDEMHELANNKRGVHLSLSIERLQEMANDRFARVGLGATLYPLEEGAKYLVGYKGEEPNDCVIVDASWSKKLDVSTISPVDDLIYTPDEKIEDETYKILDKAINASKTTLIFTNTRSGTERVVFNLKKRFKYDEDIAAHHGSLSRESRMEVEEMLKKGSLKCAVSSTSLELGVDIGSIETVIQLGSPKSVTRAVQRIGRAGHSFKSVAKGRVLVLNRDDLVECTIMLDAALKRHLDSFTVPKNALDVLAQQMIGMSLTKKWGVDEAYQVVKRAYAYHNLPRPDFDALIKYLAGKYVGLESRRIYGKIWYDEEEKTFGKRGKLAKAIYMMNLGTIPDEIAIGVIMKEDGKWIGNIQEEFLTKLTQGDIFTLGGRLYRFEYARGMKCYVTKADAKSPTIPPWFSEQLPLSFELANEIGNFRRDFSKIVEKGIHRTIGRQSHNFTSKIPDEAQEYLDKLPMGDNAKIAMYNYFLEQLLFAKYVPSSELMLIEYTRDLDEDKYYLIFHSLYGKRVNDTLARAFGIEMADELDTDLGVMLNDNGFMLVFDQDPKLNASKIDKLIARTVKSDIETSIKKNIRNTELMRRKFRHVAGRSFMILKNYKGFKMGVGRQQVNSQIILKAVEQIDKNFPLVRETYREILNDVMDLPRAKEILKMLDDRDLKYKFIETPFSSPFAHNLITFGHADAVMMKEKHMYLQELHKKVMKKIGG